MKFSQFILTSVAYLVTSFIDEEKKEEFQSFLKNDPLPMFTIDTFDYVIVGGGTAGCVLANRLSERSNITVLLLEIGGTPPPPTKVPYFMGSYMHLEEMAFQYKSIQQNHTSTVFPNGQVVVRAGKGLGGTTLINGMFYNRGNPKDYDNWANITGDDSWKYDNILQFFKKIEDYKGAYPKSDHHGYSGQVTISSQKYGPGLHLWLEAGANLGYPNADPNGPQPTRSVGPIEYTKRHGRRVSSYDAYIKPIEHTRKNLKIIKFANVTSIAIDDHFQAFGVYYEKMGITKFVKASKEIILSAGTFGTPQILWKSGIGPAKELKALGIQPKLVLPVGEHLMDHPLVPLRIMLNESTITHFPDRDITEEAITDYLENGDGPLVADKSLLAQGFDVSSFSKSPDWPDIQYSIYAQDFARLKVPKFPYEENVPAIFILPYLAKPQSVGTIKPNPHGINDPPLIDFNFLSNSDDLMIYIEAVNRSLTFFEKSTAYGSVNATYSNAVLEHCKEFSFRSNEYWSCYIRHYIFPGNHGSGTCRMGQETDPHAVVDSKLRVRGIKGLRIADASIMPVITNTNTQAAVYMVAEKLSEIINF